MSKNFKEIRINGRLFSQAKYGCEQTGLLEGTLKMRLHRERNKKKPKDEFIIVSNGKVFTVKLIKQGVF